MLKGILEVHSAARNVPYGQSVPVAISTIVLDFPTLEKLKQFESGLIKEEHTGFANITRFFRQL